MGGKDMRDRAALNKILLAFARLYAQAPTGKFVAVVNPSTWQAISGDLYDMVRYITSSDGYDRCAMGFTTFSYCSHTDGYITRESSSCIDSRKVIWFYLPSSFFTYNPKSTKLPSGVGDDDEVQGEITKPAVCPRCGSSRIEPSRDRDKHWFCKGCGWEK